MSASDLEFQGEEWTRLIHGGPNKDPLTGASSIPIYQASTYDQPDPLHLGTWDYSRSGNPTREALESTFASLERGAIGLAFGSGMAATSSVLMMFEPGDHLVVSEDIYGGTYRILYTVFKRWKLEVTWVDASHLDLVEKAIQPNTKAILVETPSNPTLKITDLHGVVEIAKKRKLLSIVDNTFMTPWLQKPLDLGFDIVIHSATKFLAGHSDVVLGLAATRELELGKRLRQMQNAFGAIPGPMDCWLTLRGIRTLGVRLEAQQKGAQILAEWLDAQPSVSKVYYPGLQSHAGYSIHGKQSTGGGAVLSFVLNSGEEAVAFLKALKIPLRAVSLGGVETIVSYPRTMSHAAMPEKERHHRGITDGLLRVSVGLESVNDLILDFQQAFQTIKENTHKEN